MDKRSNSFHDEWSKQAADLIDGPVRRPPYFIPEVPSDGRDLPDADLDQLAEAILRNLTGGAVEDGSHAVPEKP